MAVSAAKIRLGWLDTMMLGTVDLGSSMGGAELVYNPTHFSVEIDQALSPVRDFKVKEELTIKFILAESSRMQLLAAAMAYAPAGVTTVTGTPNTDTLYFGGGATVPQNTFDFSSPQNDGTTNKILGHLNIVVSFKPIKLVFDRTKNTTIDAVELLALADATQPVGQQLGWLRTQY